MFAWLGLFVSTDALLTLFWALALWAYLRALDHDRWRDWLLLGIVCGLGLLSKYTMAAFLGAAFLHLLVFRRDRLASAKPWAASLRALLILSPTSTGTSPTIFRPSSTPPTSRSNARRRVD